jgi:hypothetical protein
MRVAINDSSSTFEEACVKSFSKIAASLVTLMISATPLAAAPVLAQSTASAMTPGAIQALGGKLRMAKRLQRKSNQVGGAAGSGGAGAGAGAAGAAAGAGGAAAAGGLSTLGIVGAAAGAAAAAGGIAAAASSSSSP